ncbi:hypothetical protein [Rhodococcus sp. USK13]|uniref:hypothetical protein n=1 Tax=Rhodococcus sp. USK13 TaxID=2806442 RepID=UPI001BD0F278|nr:hypothetical protein [Rhodococcus sp. USK13]
MRRGLLARYGVTANAIAPGAETRLTATVPDDKKIDAGDFDQSEHSPDNIAPLALFMASGRSDWLSDRVLSAQGYQVGLYSSPEEIRSLSRTPLRGSSMG